MHKDLHNYFKDLDAFLRISLLVFIIGIILFFFGKPILLLYYEYLYTEIRDYSLS